MGGAEESLTRCTGCDATWQLRAWVALARGLTGFACHAHAQICSGSLVAAAHVSFTGKFSNGRTVALGTDHKTAR